MGDEHSHHDHAGAGQGDPPFGVHGMLLVGEAPIYLSHLPMFMAPHNFQVILEVSLDPEAGRLLGESRARAGADRLCTVRPEPFAITDLLPGDAGEPSRQSFVADLFTGHFEKGGTAVAGSAEVHVDRVVHFRELGDQDKAPDLGYILFGSGAQTFLAHSITRPPDFDQVLTVNATGRRFTPDEQSRERSGVRVSVPGRTNTAASRLRPGERTAGQAHVVGAHQFHELELEVLAEIYFEDGELREDPTFAPTQAERKAGFGDG